MTRELDVVEKIASSISLSALSYIKPGAPHRYSHHRWVLEYSTIGVTLLGPLAEAVQRGIKIARGDISSRESGVGRLILDSYNAVIQRYGTLPPLSHFIPALPVLAAASSHTLQYRGRISASALRSSIRSLLIGCRGRELAEVVRRLYNIGDSSIEGALRDSRISEASADAGNINMLDVFEALSKVELAYEELLNPNLILKSSRAMLDHYGKLRDVNSAVVRGYLELLRSVDSIPEWLGRNVDELLKSGAVGTREGFRKLYNLDRKAREESLDLSGLLPTLTLAVYIAAWEGL